ncbi:c-type cytochrome [Catenovulum maritimum]|uniref:Cytochrome C n=1 Tax=Catenovulum maritimum TaxID=1513271 RepID=A0A0J8GYV5_9ALTE|nr:c-type cytochrome [Catenovulum maritimum]KMT65918.1 cytochrome C [Catenovulum maritimum]
MKKTAIALAMFVGLTTVSQASTITGNAEAGKNKSATCAACHGADGNSMIPANPTLAGQSADYLFKQLKDFKSGDRSNAIMSGMVAALSEQDMKDLATYFSAQEAKAGSTPEFIKNKKGEEVDVVKVAGQLYKAGNATTGLTACSACHLPDGSGLPLAGFPKLSGQHAEYIANQLKAFREGDRANDLNGMMQKIAAKLSDKEITLLSNYISGLH